MVKLKRNEMCRLDNIYELSEILDINGLEGSDRDELVLEYSIQYHETDGDIFLFCFEVDMLGKPTKFYNIISADELEGYEEDVTPKDKFDEDDGLSYEEYQKFVKEQEEQEEQEELDGDDNIEFMGSTLTIKTDDEITPEQIRKIKDILNK